MAQSLTRKLKTGEQSKKKMLLGVSKTVTLGCHCHLNKEKPNIFAQHFLELFHIGMY